MTPSQLSNPSTLSKKSFPKYFFDKQKSGKSVQKYYEKELGQREKSRAVVGGREREERGKLEERGSPQKLVGDVFSRDPFVQQSSNFKPRDITQEVVPEVFDSEACSQ